MSGKYSSAEEYKKHHESLLKEYKWIAIFCFLLPITSIILSAIFLPDPYKVPPLFGAILVTFDIGALPISFFGMFMIYMYFEEIEWHENHKHWYN